MAMDVLERLNRKFGAWYEGLFGGGIGGAEGRELRPRDILRQILAAMEDERREGLDGRVYVPNVYMLQVAAESEDERHYLRTFLDAEELATAVQEAADRHGYGMRGTLVFAVEEVAARTLVTPNGGSGAKRVHIRCRFDAQANGETGATPDPPVAVAAVPSSPPSTTPFAAPPLPRPPAVVEDEDDDPGTVPAVSTVTLATLVVRGRDGQFEDVYPLSAHGAQIGRGRSAGNDIVIPGDAQISKVHARLIAENGIFRVEDCGSTNGTFINERRLEKGQSAVLAPEDRIRLGETTLLFRPTPSPKTPEPSAMPVPNLPAQASENVPPARETGNEGPGQTRRYRFVTSDGETFALASEMSVGRALTGDIVLIGTGVGSQHARVTVRGTVVYVEDLGTPGGTRVNGERIPVHFPVALYDGDAIQFGEAQVRLEKLGDLPGWGRSGGD